LPPTRLWLSLGVLLLAGTVTTPEPSLGRSAQATLAPFHLEVEGQDAEGLLAVPAQPPRILVVVAHGWTGSAETHRADLTRLADAGMLAVAMEFRGARDDFKVATGVADTVAATLALQRAYPGLERTFVFGWSMGGEIALLSAIAAPAGTYDDVFVGAGVADLAAFWDEQPIARAALDRETGGSPADHASAYRLRSPVDRAVELAGRGVERVTLVHGAADTMVSLDEAERLYVALRDAGQAVSFYVVTVDRVPVDCAPPPVCPDAAVAPAGHLAGMLRLMWPFLQDRAAGLPEPQATSLRGTYDGATGDYAPTDVGP
jgi:dienelactone hydrolase